MIQLGLGSWVFALVREQVFAEAIPDSSRVLGRVRRYVFKVGGPICRL